MTGKRVDQPGALGKRDERVGKDQAVLGVLPAHQCLGADKVSGKVDFGLVIQHQLIALECPPQVPDHRELGRGVPIDARVVTKHPKMLALGDIHRDVGALHQDNGVVAVLTGDHHPDAGLHVQVHAVDLERGLQN